MIILGHYLVTTTNPFMSQICSCSTFMTLSPNMDKSCLALPLQLSFSSGSRWGYFDCVTIWGTSYQGMLNRFWNSKIVTWLFSACNNLELVKKIPGTCISNQRFLLLWTDPTPYLIGFFNSCENFDNTYFKVVQTFIFIHV